MNERDPRKSPTAGDMLRKDDESLDVLAVDQRMVSVVVRTDQGDRRSARVPLDQFRRGTRRAKVLALGVPR